MDDPDGQRVDLQRQVRLAPDDDAPRLVFADWLQERGDPYGAFVAAQCALARADRRADPGAYDALRHRERQLWAAHGEAWCAACGGTRRELRFARGFVREVSLEPRKGRIPAVAIARGMADQPVEELGVGFEPAGPSAEELGALRDWLDAGAPPTLALHGMAFPNVARAEPIEVALAHLLGSPGLVRVRHLQLAWFLVAETGDWAAPLTSNPALTELRSLQVSIGGDLADVRALLAHPAAARLEAFGLRHNHLTQHLPSRDVLAALPPTIRDLTVTRGVASDAEGWPAQLQALDALRWEVALDGAALTRLLGAVGGLRELALGVELDGGVDALRAALDRGTLRRLDLRECRVDVAGAEALTALAFGGLEAFVAPRSVPWVDDPHRAAALGRALTQDRRERLATLGLGESDGGADGLAAFAASGALVDVEDLTLPRLDRAAVEVLDANAPRLRRLTVHRFAAGGCEALLACGIAPRLERLEVRSGRGVEALARSELPALGVLRMIASSADEDPAVRRAPWFAQLDRPIG